MYFDHTKTTRIKQKARFNEKMEVAQRSPYTPNQHSSYYSRGLNGNEGECVTLHPLIIGKHIVVCMPEVNKVLRNVYQVLSQANYYLSKHGISSRRYSGAQLIRIKMLGILGHDAKVCSYILQEDAEMVFDSFDLTGNSRKSSRIIWMDPVLLDEKPMPSPPNKINDLKIADIQHEFPIKVHQFRLGDDIIVCTPDVQKVIQVTFNQGAAGYYFSKLGIVPYKFVHSAHLDKIKELKIIKRSAVHCTYVMKEDAMKVFDAYGMTVDEIDEKVLFLEVIDLSSVTPSWKPVKIKNEGASPSMMNLSRETSPSGIVSPNVNVYQSSIGLKSDNEDEEEESIPLMNDNDMKVHVFLVENEEVVCMPDIHKIVQNIHGNSIQVNYYFNKLKVLKRRFCFAHLRELKSRGILQNNATYCTYVPRADAEKLFQIYCLVRDPKLSEIMFTETINLDAKHSSEDADGMGDCINGEQPRVKIHTFDLDSNIVITTPDVHKIVDFLEEQSASLDYHFRKLGITKYRFTYSQLHQLRRLNVIKRPTVCTFISQSDVERLLGMYQSERNRLRIKNVEFLPPIVLAPGKNQASKSKVSFDNSFDRPSFRPPHSLDASPSFIDSAPPLLAKAEILSPTSTAMQHIQNIHPTIDCPIVIPNGDYDPAKVSDVGSTSRNSMNEKRAHPMDANDGPVYKKYAPNGFPTTDELFKDLSRKEAELRLLYDGYQRDIEEERNRRKKIEMKFEEMTKFHTKELGELKAKQLALEGEITKLKDEVKQGRLVREHLQQEINSLAASPPETTSPDKLSVDAIFMNHDSSQELRE